jgi:hypothetical protein
MKKLLVGLLLLFVMGSCLTESRIARNCEKFAAVCGNTTHTTISKDTIINISDTVPVPLPPDTVIIAGDVEIIEGVATFKPVYVEGSLIATYAEVKNGRLYVKSTLRVKTIQSIINMNVTIPNAIRETSSITAVPVKYIPSAYKWAFWLVVLQLVAAIFFLLKKFNIFDPISIVGKLLGR